MSRVLDPRAIRYNRISRRESFDEWNVKFIRGSFICRILFLSKRLVRLINLFLFCFREIRKTCQRFIDAEAASQQIVSITSKDKYVKALRSGC